MAIFLDRQARSEPAPRPLTARLSIGRPIATILPGLGLTALIALLAAALRLCPPFSGLSPMILGIVIGIGINTVFGTPAWAKAGTRFAMRRLLRLAIVLLGLQLTVAQVASVGVSGVAVIVATVLSTFAFTVWLGRRLGVDEKLAELIAAGTSICGASAIVATNTVSGASDEDVAYAVACVTIFGSIAMLAYPLLPAVLALDARAYGLWSGASIHEIAQVAAAAFQHGAEAGEFGTVSKLARVMMLAPMILAVGFFALRRSRGDRNARPQVRPPMPWFVLGFVALVALNSSVALPPDVKAATAGGTTVLLSMALAAMGLDTSIAGLRARGLRPFCLGLAAFVFIACFSLLWVKLIG